MNSIWPCVIGVREVVGCCTTDYAGADDDSRAGFGGIGGLVGKYAGEVGIAIGHHVVGLLETTVGCARDEGM